MKILENRNNTIADSILDNNDDNFDCNADEVSYRITGNIDKLLVDNCIQDKVYLD